MRELLTMKANVELIMNQDKEKGERRKIIKPTVAEIRNRNRRT